MAIVLFCNCCSNTQTIYPDTVKSDVVAAAAEYGWQLDEHVWLCPAHSANAKGLSSDYQLCRTEFLEAARDFSAATAEQGDLPEPDGFYRVQRASATQDAAYQRLQASRRRLSDFVTRKDPPPPRRPIGAENEPSATPDTLKNKVPPR